MSQKREDIRTKRTRKLLRQALIDLISEKGYHSVTVTELADRAMINRATFYRYYEDKEDLLFRGMDEFFDSFAGFEDRLQPAEAADILTASLQHIKEHRQFYELMLGPRGHPAFQERIRSYHLEIMHTRLNTAGAAEGRSSDDIAVRAGFAAGAFGGIIRAWIETGCRQDPQNLARTTLQLIKGGVFAD
jgi:AcrR family transcriptional regulator